jgi:hypothetical protein
MISSIVWARLILPSATLHSVNSVAPCCRVAWYCSGARRVVHSANSTLQLHCSYLSDLPAQSC